MHMHMAAHTAVFATPTAGAAVAAAPPQPQQQPAAAAPLLGQTYPTMGSSVRGGVLLGAVLLAASLMWRRSA